MNTHLPVGKGAYLLIVRLTRPTRLQVGQLGTFELAAGCYAYAGSALGSGGLAARLGRHARQDKRPHWHIDHLLKWGALDGIWYVESTARLECAWAHALTSLPGAQRPIARFGSSDCACPGHLIALPLGCDGQTIRAALAGTVPALSNPLYQSLPDTPLP